MSSFVIPMIGFAVRKTRLTHQYLTQSGVCSVNIPSPEFVKQTDYCGIVSGKNIDKTKHCGFEIFCGDNNSVPMIKECPVNLECRVSQIFALPSHDYFICEILRTYIDENLYREDTVLYENIESVIYMKKIYKSATGNLGIPYLAGL